MSRLWRIGILGAGYMADEYVRVILKHPRFQVIAVVSPGAVSAKRLASKYNNQFEGLADAEELFASNRIDAAIVAVPEENCLQVVLNLLRFDSTLLIEKPAGLDLFEARELSKMGKQYQGTNFVAFNRRYYSSCKLALGQFASDDGPRLIDVLDQQDPILALSAGFSPKVVDKWMYANSIHIVDLARSFARGSVEKVSTGEWPFNPHQRVRFAEVHFNSGDFFRYLAAWNAPGPWSVDITTPRKRVTLKPLEDVYVQEEGNRFQRKIRTSIRDKRFKPGLWELLSDLDLYLRGGRCSLPSLEESLASMELVHAIYFPEDVAF